MSRIDLPRVAVLGAGPVGLEAALHAATLKLPVTVYEKGKVGEHLRAWGHVRLFSPFGMNSTPQGRARIRADQPGHDIPDDGDILTGRQHLAAYLEPLARSPLLAGVLKAETAVVQVGRRGWLKEGGAGDPRRGGQPFILLLRQGKGERVEEADVVLDCTGTYGQPRFLGEGGIPAAGESAARPHIAGGLEDVLGERRQHYADRTTLVVGAGYSAATTVCALSALAEKHPGTWIIWLARGAGTQPIRRFVNDPLRERDQLAVRANNLATRGEGNVEFHAQAVVAAVESAGPDKGFKVGARCAGRVMTWDVDRVVGNVGYSPNTDLYRELHVHECYATLGPMALAAALGKHAGADCLAIPAQGAATLRNPEPNFYILGAKSYGRNSNFLLRVGFEQVREAFGLIAASPELRARFPALARLRPA
jgi:thioredoxin reductase